MASIAALKKLPIRRKRGVPAGVWLGAALLMPFAVFGPNALVGIYGLAVFLIGVLLLWRPGEPQILVLIFLYQWSQCAVGALYGNAVGLSLNELAGFSGQHDYASALMLTSIIVLAICMRATAGEPISDLGTRIKEMVGARPFNFWLRVYAAAWLFGAVCELLASVAGGLSIFLFSLSGVKWAGFVLLTFAAFHGTLGKVRSIWVTVFFFELTISFGGFFSSFKDVFIYALLGVGACNNRLGARSIAWGTFFGALLIILGLIWSSIKGDYRNFVSGGSGAQVVAVNLSERVDELSRLIKEIDMEKMANAVDTTFKRIMYYHYFGAATAYVPDIIPYTGGEIWGEAVQRPFMPRLLFPEKSAINDSDLTIKYSGIAVAKAEQGTSISLGYMAEAYIDFGPILMFAAIGALGAGLGFFYRWLLHQRGSLAVIGAAQAPFALMPALFAETSILKMISTLVLNFIACQVVFKYISPVLFRRVKS